MEAMKSFSPAFMIADMLKGKKNKNNSPHPRPMPDMEGEVDPVEAARKARMQRERRGTIYSQAM